MNVSAFAKLTARAKEKMREYFDLDLKLRFGVKTIHQNDGGSENDSEDDVDNRHAVPVEGALDDTKAGISLDTMFLSKDDVKSIFDPIFAEITKLVKRQLSKAETNMGRPIAVGLLKFSKEKSYE